MQTFSDYLMFWVAQFMAPFMILGGIALAVVILWMIIACITKIEDLWEKFWDGE